jgi:hypothetical protein
MARGRHAESLTARRKSSAADTLFPSLHRGRTRRRLVCRASSPVMKKAAYRPRRDRGKGYINRLVARCAGPLWPAARDASAPNKADTDNNHTAAAPRPAVERNKAAVDSWRRHRQPLPRQRQQRHLPRPRHPDRAAAGSRHRNSRRPAGDRPCRLMVPALPRRHTARARQSRPWDRDRRRRHTPREPHPRPTPGALLA